MQTFLPFESFVESARVLDNKRLGKQRVEGLQILKTLSIGEFTCHGCHQKVTHFNPYKTGYHCYQCEAPLKRTPWYNHPAVLMWKSYENALILYLQEICMEWIKRGFKDNCWEQIEKFSLHKETMLPDWFGESNFHLSHQSNLLRKNPEYYGQFFFGVPSDIPYFWPVRKVK
jgi:hypothetical protein